MNEALPVWAPTEDAFEEAFLHSATDEEAQPTIRSVDGTSLHISPQLCVARSTLPDEGYGAQRARSRLRARSCCASAACRPELTRAPRARTAPLLCATA
jgi:hypothetical protein